MKQQILFAGLLGSLVLLAGCEAPKSALVNGKITPATGHPKVGVVSADISEVAKALDEFQRNSTVALASGSLNFSQVVAAKSDGSYTVELKSSQPNVAFALYAWNDANDNSKLDGVEGVTLGKTTRATQTGQYYYGFLKTPISYQAIKDQSGTLGPIESGYDFTLQ
ncbi:MAG: hypothetical protein ACM3YO_07410 [Bacteroidota bacterium]